jgi:hypothetical protein
LLRLTLALPLSARIEEREALDAGKASPKALCRHETGAVVRCNPFELIAGHDLVSFGDCSRDRALEF